MKRTKYDRRSIPSNNQNRSPSLSYSGERSSDRKQRSSYGAKTPIYKVPKGSYRNPTPSSYRNPTQSSYRNPKPISYRNPTPTSYHTIKARRGTNKPGYKNKQSTKIIKPKIIKGTIFLAATSLVVFGSISILNNITTNNPGGVVIPDPLSFICTCVEGDGTSSDDFYGMADLLKDIDYEENIMDDSVSKNDLKDFFERKVSILYHTGHGSPGSIATTSSSLSYNDLTTINVANTIIATCSTLANTGWMDKFGTNTNTFSGYTETTWTSGDMPVINGYVDHLKTGESYTMAFYLVHQDINLYLDRWCIYVKENGNVVEYSARTGNNPSRTNRVQIDEAGKLYVTEALDNALNNIKQSSFEYNSYQLGPITTTTHTAAQGLSLLQKTTITQAEAVEIAIDYIKKHNYQEPDQVLDRIIPINLRLEKESPAELGGWEVHFAKNMDDGLNIRTNGLALHMSILITGKGQVVTFRKRWAPTKAFQRNLLNNENLLSVSEALSIAKSSISEKIKPGGTFVLTDWVQVYRIDSNDPSNLKLKPAYGFIEGDGGIIVVDVQDGNLVNDYN